VKREAFFLFFCTIFVASEILAQKTIVKIPSLLFTKFVNSNTKDSHLLVNDVGIKQSSKQILPSNFYATQLGFFCKQEIKLEKLTKIPFRFRLGSVEECDKLEGKDKP
jgi:hypothetical protein